MGMSLDSRARVESEAQETLSRMERFGEHLEYRGFIGSIEDSPEDGVVHGKLLGIHSLVSCNGGDLDTLQEQFHGASHQLRRPLSLIRTCVEIGSASPRIAEQIPQHAA